MARLRDPESGCPWDVRQTFASIIPYTIEEAYEVADAVERDDLAELKSELGDLLFQVVFLSRIAEERRLFDFGQVVEAIVDKLVRRHPHVFGEARAGSDAELASAWEAHKAEERRARAGAATGPVSILDDVGAKLPALMRAVKLQKRAAHVGFDWTEPQPVLAKIEEELQEVRDEIDARAPHRRVEHEVGDLLLACTNLARHLGVNPETALRHANGRFESRFKAMETMAAERGTALADLSLEAQEQLWLEAKLAERETEQ
jgi:ATP diphosphatase